MKTLYFSATENSLYVAKRLGGELLSILALMKQGVHRVDDDAVGIVCPIYEGDVPKMVRSFIEQTEIHAGYFFIVCTYGFNATSGPIMAAKRLAAAGRVPDYVNKILMVDNFLPGFEIGAELKKEPGKQIDSHLDSIAADIKARQKKTIKNDLSSLVAGPMLRAFSKKGLSGDAAKHYLVNDNCVHCGICAKVCPADNITVSGSKPQFADRCEVCYACAHNCPKNAIHVPHERSAARFRNANITLPELIAANNTK